jgi:hypothetical protein
LYGALTGTTPSQKQSSKESEIATLRYELSEARKSAQRDRDALRAALEEIQALRLAAQPKSSSSVPIAAAPVVTSSNSAIATYLGAPVPAPANLDRKYSPDELAAVFRDLAATLGIEVGKLDVDTTEFPFIIHGRIESTAGAGFFKKIDSELRALPGYTYGGCVTGRTQDGATYFALNMIPSSAYPREHAEAIGRRTMLRLQMLAAASRDLPP